MNSFYKLPIIVYFNLISFLIFGIYAFLKVQNCECYWMHDASISITKSWIFGYLSFLFLLPILFVFICNVFKIREIGKELFLLYVTSLISISSLLLSINQPCKFINGGYFMFIDSSLILLYYLSNDIFLRFVFVPCFAFVHLNSKLISFISSCFKISLNRLPLIKSYSKLLC